MRLNLKDTSDGTSPHQRCHVVLLNEQECLSKACFPECKGFDVLSCQFLLFNPDESGLLILADLKALEATSVTIVL